MRGPRTALAFLAGAFETVVEGWAPGVVPAMWSNGTVAANVGRLWARTCVAASNPDASLISVGSLNAVPKKLIPSGTPYYVQFVGCVGDAQSMGKPAGTCTMGYPGPAANPDVPKMKWSPKSRSVDHAGLSVADTTASSPNWLIAASMPFTPALWSMASA